MHLVLIHGANQSSKCFNYIIERLSINFTQITLIDYNSQNGFFENLNKMIQSLRNTGPMMIVGHSLGGIYALHLTQYCDVKGVVTLSTPFGGSKSADWAKYVIPYYQLFRDVGRRSKPILDGHDIKIDIPWIQVVTMSGSVPYLEGPNDGVVTFASMRYRENHMTCIDSESNHYDIMCNPQAVEIIEDLYNDLL